MGKAAAKVFASESSAEMFYKLIKEHIKEKKRNQTPSFSEAHLADSIADSSLSAKDLNEPIQEKKLTLNLLSLAVQHGLEEIVRVLLEKGVDINERTQPVSSRETEDFSFLTSALVHASATGHLAIVNQLLKHIEENKKLQIGTTLNASDLDVALIAACLGGHLEIVKALCDKGANINAALSIPLVGYTPLTSAIKFGHKDIVFYLLKCKEINPDQRSPKPFSVPPIYYAALSSNFRDNPDILDSLLKKIKKVHQKTDLGDFDGGFYCPVTKQFFPLLMACCNRNSALTKKILEYPQTRADLPALKEALQQAKTSETGETYFTNSAFTMMCSTSMILTSVVTIGAGAALVKLGMVLMASAVPEAVAVFGALSAFIGLNLLAMAPFLLAIGTLLVVPAAILFIAAKCQKAHAPECAKLIEAKINEIEARPTEDTVLKISQDGKPPDTLEDNQIETPLAFSP